VDPTLELVLGLAIQILWIASISSHFIHVYTPASCLNSTTEGPGFIDDEESYETLGEILALPRRFRDKRAYVESVVRPIDTVRSTKTFEKEYFNE